jgi:hypothetical protein
VQHFVFGGFDTERAAGENYGVTGDIGKMALARVPGSRGPRVVNLGRCGDEPAAPTVGDLPEGEAGVYLTG